MENLIIGRAKIMTIGMSDLWVFGYGSLMWRPGFDAVEILPARLSGFHRALCVHSYVHRGTRERPGLVLGLDRGGSCHGLAFRVEAAKREAVIDYLRGRELVTNVYLERLSQVILEDGRKLDALSYVVDRSHAQYAAGLTVDEAAQIVAGAAGLSGTNPEYVANTVQHLRQMGIHDVRLEGIVKQLQLLA
jgi:glutathione-specific gamma-glutamylcyclotransferase